MSLITIASRYGTSAKMLFTRCVNQNRLPLTSFTSPSPFKITSFSDRSISVGLRLFASKSSPSSKAPAKKSAVVKKTASKTASKASPKTATKVSKASKTKKTVVVKKAAPKKAVKSVEAKKKDDAEKASLAKDKLKERQARDKEREIQMREKEKARLVKLKEKERLTQAKEKAKAVILKEKERKAALPKRPKSAFTYFMTQQINGRAKLYDGKQSVEIMPLAAAKWAKMSDSERRASTQRLLRIEQDTRRRRPSSSRMLPLRDHLLPSSSTLTRFEPISESRTPS